MSDYTDKPDTINQTDNDEVSTVNIDDLMTADLLDRDATDIPALADFWCISLRVIEQDIVMVINLNDDLMLGRKDESSPPRNFIDLTAYNALQYGVSRQHAVLSLQNSRIAIKDNNSSNSTLLNKRKLEPHKQYILQPGDIISLGRLELQFELIFDPFGM